MTHSTKRVLGVLLEAPREEVYGFELCQAAGLPSGTVYPILRRLERAGLVSSRWEMIDQAEAGRRRRRYYMLTGAGQPVAREATAAEADALRMLNPGWAT